MIFYEYSQNLIFSTFLISGFYSVKNQIIFFMLRCVYDIELNPNLNFYHNFRLVFMRSIKIVKKNDHWNWFLICFELEVPKIEHLKQLKPHFLLRRVRCLFIIQNRTKWSLITSWKYFTKSGFNVWACRLHVRMFDS